MAEKQQPQPLGPIFRAARERVHLTQSQLASRVGLAHNHITRLENREKGVPRFDTVARLAAELGLSLDELAKACGYTSSSGVRPKDRAAIAQAANDLTEAIGYLRSAGEALSTLAQSLQRQAGIPKILPERPRPEPRKKKRRKTKP